MAGLLRVIVQFRYSVSQRGIERSTRLLKTLASKSPIDLWRRNRAYFSSETKLAVKTTMSEDKNIFELLPSNVVPHHYDITLKPDLVNFKFEGNENIHIKVNEETDTVLLNSSKLEIKNVSFQGNDGQHMVAKNYHVDEDKSILTIEFPEKISTGKLGQLSLQFSGILHDKMRGLYRCKYTSLDGNTKYAAVTQFEANDARLCFPCWDEPALKATFDISLIVPKNLSAFSNMPVKQEIDNGDLVLLKYDTTPKMSTYLVAVAVGEFDCVEDKTDSGVAVRVYTPRGKAEQGRFALEVSVRCLSFYDHYFKIAYPLPKLDSVAVPDFAAGAMENWGLVMYRESCLLYDENNSSTANMQSIGLTVAHELAHQWFGNLVTMKWWTDLWLNEGYATFIEYLCVEELYPEFEAWKQFVTDIWCKAMELDALKNSHPVEVKVYDPATIDEIFDDISYCKGASVIRMLYSWIGKEDFMKGMTSYLNKYAYSNAQTDDLWESLECASSKPVSKVMPCWTGQTGFPVLSVEQRQQGNDRVLSFEQQRFLANGSKDDETLWMIPVNICTSANPSEIAMSTLISGKTAEVVVPNVPPNEWIKINPGTIGFYRTRYSQEMLHALLPSIQNKTLPAVDRFGLLDDLFNSVKAGYSSTVEVLNVLQSYKQEDDYIVWNSIVTCLSRIQSLICHLPFYEDFRKFSRSILKDISRKVGWDAKPGESHLNIFLRSIVLNRMVMLQDEEIIKEAKCRFERHIAGTELIPADLRRCVYTAMLNNGDESTFDRIIKLYQNTELHEEKNRILTCLGVVQDMNLLKKALEFSISDSVRGQDTIFVFHSTAWSDASRNYTWEFVKENWDALNDKVNMSLILRLIKWTSEGFVSEGKARDVEEFFGKLAKSGFERPVKQSVEKIRMNAEWLARDKEAIEKFLKSQ